MPRSSKDIAKRLRFDHRPRRDLFRRWYLPVGLATCAVAAALWAAFAARVGDRQYLPGPVTPAHATFGDRCAQCHVSFASTPNERCETCHHPAPHSEFQSRVPACRECHVEHRGAALLSGVADQPCIACHERLDSTHTPAVATALADFAAHPEFRPLRAGAVDPARLRFNHQIHLTSKNVRDPLACADCHRVAADGSAMQPIRFETHCRRCHELKVKEAPQPLGNLEVPHDRPEVVRQGLRDRLAALAVARPQELFASGAIEILIPGQAPRGAVDDSRTLQEFQKKWVARFENELYRPFTDSNPGSATDPLLEDNKYCFLCHIQGASGAGELPVVEETRIPAHWLPAAKFSHTAHDKLDCAVCHDKVRESRDTVMVNLPPLAVCQKCHADGRAQSAGTGCTMCHQYHRPVSVVSVEGTPAAPTPRPTVALDTLLPR